MKAEEEEKKEENEEDEKKEEEIFKKNWINKFKIIETYNFIFKN